MVSGFKVINSVYFKDGTIEEVDCDKFASVSDTTCHFVEFYTSRGVYGYVSGSEAVVDEAGGIGIKYHSWVRYLKYDEEKREWAPTDDIEKVLVNRMEDSRGNVVYSGVCDSGV